MTHIFCRSFGFFFCLFSISSLTAGPVVPGQALWCVTKHIASSVDAVESMINIIYGDISVAQVILTSELNVLGSSINVIQSSAGIIASELPLLASCMATAFTASTTISISGYYCLSTTNTVGIITVQAATNNVVVDLNGHRVQGVVIQNNNQILFRNGTVDGSNMTGFGIDVQSGSTNITLRTIDLQNAQVGIHMSGVANGLIDSCSMSLNFTAVQLNQCQNIVVNNSVASINRNADFDLISSTTCLIVDSKAISTGQGNTSVINNSVIGFSSLNGSGNVFERCIANATQALSTTDSNSIVAGFALRGTESCSKIIGCEASDATTSPSGVTIPYGILLQAQTSGLITVTALNINGTINQGSGAAWSPDGKYLAVADGSLSTNLFVYQVNYLTGSLTQVASIRVGNSGDVIFALSWSPTYYLAVGVDGSSTIPFIYYFDTDNQALTQITSTSGTSGILQYLSWSPDGTYLATGVQAGSTLNNYKFDPLAQTLTRVQSISGAADYAVAWSPNGLYLAAGVSTLLLYSFNRGTSTLTQINTQPTPGSIGSLAWSPNGKYLAVGDFAGHLTIFQFNGTTAQQMVTTLVGMYGEVLSIQWSSDGNYLIVGGAGLGPGFGLFSLAMYQFNPGVPSLTQLYLVNPAGGSGAYSDTINAVAWSPDGQYVAVAASTTGAAHYGLVVVQALTFPNANLINNNVVYCNSGGSVPFGIGISGSSIANMIIQNTCYSNPIAPFMVDTSYAFVQNVFNQSFGDAPTLLQNTVMGYRQPIAQPANLGLIARQILNQVTTTAAACTPTTLTSSNVSSGTISLTASGNYCLGAVITSDIAITGTSVVLNLNDFCLTGDIIISGDDALVYNGTVISPAVATTGSINAGIDILAATNRAIINNVIVDATTQPTAVNTGRYALRTAGLDTQVYNCTLTGGPALSATGSANGTAGGSGVVVTGSATRTLIRNCTISGGNGGNGGTTTPFGNGGTGGHGIQVQAGSVSLVEIDTCVIETTGLGGAPGTTNGTKTGGNGGDGINIDASAAGVAVHNCIIRNTGAAGLSATQTLVTALAPMISVIDTADGKAVNDFVTTAANLSVIFGNFADTVKNPIVYNLNNRQATPGTDPTNGDGGLLVSNPPDATSGGGNVIVNHIVNVFMSVLT